MNYRNLIVKKPVEDKNYKEQSDFILSAINRMVDKAFRSGKKQIILNTNILGDFPLSNINKLAAPLIESWSANIFSNICKETNNEYSLINVETGKKRTDLADVVLQFKRNVDKKTKVYSTGNVDVKSTTDTIRNSGKGPNITSFSKIRSEYVKDPNFIFIILSIKYHPYSQKQDSGEATCIIDLSDFNSYDFKYLSENDFSINPALGTGQIQIKDIHYVNVEERTTWELLKVLDEKYISSSKHTFNGWKQEAEKNKWIK